MKLLNSLQNTFFFLLKENIGQKSPLPLKWALSRTPFKGVLNRIPAYCQLTGVSVFISIFLLAQSGYSFSLDEMQKMALANRDIVKRYMVDLEKSDRDIKRARAGYYPSVDLSYQVNSLDEASTTEDKENSIVYGSVSWNLFNGFKDKYSTQSAELIRVVDALQLAGLEQDIQLNVALRYLDVYERRASLEVTEKNYETLSKVFRDGENRLAVGLIDKNELLKFKVDLDNSDIQVKASRAGLEKGVNLLSREVGESLQLSNLDFAEFEQIPKVMDPAKTVPTMMTSRSELLALEKLVDASLVQIKSEQSDYFPKVNLVGSYSKYDDDYVNGSGDVNEDELRAQLVFSLNLFKGFATEESVARARLENRGLQYDVKELKDTLQTDLQNLHIDYDVSLRNVDVALKNIEHAEESLRITQLKYDEGLERESDLLDAITNLSRARYNHVAVLRTVFLNRFHIMRMIEAFGKEQ